MRRFLFHCRVPLTFALVWLSALGMVAGAALGLVAYYATGQSVVVGLVVGCTLVAVDARLFYGAIGLHHRAIEADPLWR